MFKGSHGIEIFDAEHKAKRIINLRIGHRAIMAVDDGEAALQIAKEFLKRDDALEPRRLSSADIREALTRNLKQSGVEPTFETCNTSASRWKSSDK